MLRRHGGGEVWLVSDKTYETSRDALNRSRPKPAAADNTTPTLQRKDFPVSTGPAPSEDSSVATDAPPSSPAAPAAPGRALNTAIQVAGAAAGNIAGASVAGAVSASAAAQSGASAATRKAAADAATEVNKGLNSRIPPVGREMASKTVSSGAPGVAQDVANDAREHAARKRFEKQQRDETAPPAPSTRRGTTIDPTSEDDRAAFTKRRDAIQRKTGVDVDAAVGSVVGGVASAAAVASGAAAPVAGVAGALGSRVGTAASRATHAVGSVAVKIRKHAIVATGAVVMLLVSTLSSLGSAITSQQAMAEAEEAALYVVTEQARLRAEAGSVMCTVEQRFPESYHPTMVRNAAAIYEVAQQRGLPDYAAVIAVAVAMTRSGLGYAGPGVASSQNLFGFTPSTTMGTSQLLADPAFAAGKFFDLLEGVESWGGLAVEDVGSAIIGGALASGFGAYEGAAREILGLAGHDVGAGCEAKGVPIACEPVPSIEDAEGYAGSRDTTALLRCLWHIVGVRDMSVSPGGSVIDIRLPGLFDVKSALDKPSADPLTFGGALTGTSLMSWLSATHLAFGIRSVEAADAVVTFHVPPGADEAGGQVERYVIQPRTRWDDSVPQIVRIRTHGSAGTGVISQQQTGWVHPIPDGYQRYVTSEYGWRIHPVTKTRRLHEGIDLRAPMGTPIQSPNAGTVARVYWSSTGGNIVVISHPDGSQSKFLHLSEMLVKVGDSVATGQIIAKSGNTGSSTTNPHLHYEVWVGGSSVNPRDYFERVGGPPLG